MLVSCKYCGRSHDRGAVCPSRPKRKEVKEVTDLTRFRSSKPWRTMRTQIKQRDRLLCQVCIRGLFHTYQRITIDTLEVHHIRPLAKAWAYRLDPYNLITLCKYHHTMADMDRIPTNALFDIVKEQMFVSSLAD